MEIPIPAVVVVALALFAAGGVTGWLVAGWRERRAAGGRSAAELNAELARYRSEVEAHFQRSAELFQGLTEQYRALYRHMGESAAALGVTGGEASLLTADAFEPLPAPEERAAAVDDTQPSAPGQDGAESGEEAPPGPSQGEGRDTPRDDPSDTAPPHGPASGRNAAQTAAPAGAQPPPETATAAQPSERGDDSAPAGSSPDHDASQAPAAPGSRPTGG